MTTRRDKAIAYLIDIESAVREAANIIVTGGKVDAEMLDRIDGVRMSMNDVVSDIEEQP